MVHSEATVHTDAAERYAKQLCSHANRMGARASWTPPTGLIDFAQGGRCQLTVRDDTLRLLLDAPTPDQLATIQAILSADLQRFGRRAALDVTWSGDSAPSAPARVPHWLLGARRHARPR